MKQLLVASLLLVSTLAAVAVPAKKKPQPPLHPPAPIPPAIASAKTVFLSNVCEQDYKVCALAYNQFYGGLPAATPYRLVLAPADADLIVEFHLVSRFGDITGFKGSTYSTNLTRLQVVLRDRATQVALWSVSEPAGDTALAVDAILEDLHVIIQPGALAGAPQPIPVSK